LIEIVFKRFAAFSLALIFAAHLLAGVCVCFDGKENISSVETSRCHSEKTDSESVSGSMSCCSGTVCGEPNGNVPGFVTVSTVQISASIATAVEKLIASLRPKPVFTLTVLLSKRAGDVPKLFSKPPDFYLHNHAFLI
jgi:hypothetical protein